MEDAVCSEERTGLDRRSWTMHHDTPCPEVLAGLNEFLAAGYFEEPHASPVIRWSRAVRRRFENRQLPAYSGELLYPSGPCKIEGTNRILAADFSFTWSYNDTLLEARLAGANTEERDALLAMRAAMRELGARLSVTATPHVVGGNGYTHSVPNYGRVVREGLSSYAGRVEHRLAEAKEQGDPAQVGLYLGLQDVLSGIADWHQRIVSSLRETLAENPHAERLLAAYERVPFEPARSFFEAVVAYNFVYYLDDCDNPGRVDQVLYPFYARDLASRRTTYEEAVALVRCLWKNTDANSGWSAAIGGTTSGGDAAYNELTLACLEAARGLRRPNLQLHIRRDMPQEVWDAAIETLSTACGLPALYNEEAFLDALRHADLGIRDEDLGWYNGGGCTETMIHGLSNVGSLDAGINLPLILVHTLSRCLATASTFGELLEAVKADIDAAVREIVAHVNADQRAKARLRPQPMRSLLVDDCIDTGREFNAGGARYNWSVINVAGLANLIDSLAAIKDIVFERNEKTGAELLDILQANYEGHDAFRVRLGRCPRFGNDEPGADAIAADVAAFVFNQFLQHEPWRGGKFLPSCLMFTTYVQAGRCVGATPDGRLADEAVADSAGPHQGRDTRGPTAMLRSVAAIPHHLAPGTLVVNARFARDFFDSDQGRRKLQQLFRTYFDLGGMQLQVNVMDQAVLRDAIEHPEKHEDLIVRIGGYSEYFNRLSPELKRTVLERTEHAVA